MPQGHLRHKGIRGPGDPGHKSAQIMLDHAVSNTVDTRNIRSQSSLAGIWALGPCRHSLTGVLLRLWGLLALHLQGKDSGKDMGPVRVVGAGSPGHG